MNILNGFLDNGQSGAINGQQFIGILAIALEEIDLYSHLEKNAENVVTHCKSSDRAEDVKATFQQRALRCSKCQIAGAEWREKP